MHAAVIYKDFMYVYGGLNQLSTSFADLYSLNCKNWGWERVGQFKVNDNEVKACGHSAAIYQNKILIFGGLDPSTTTIYNQIFVFYPDTSQ